MVAFIDLDTWLTFYIYSNLSNPIFDILSFVLAIFFSFAFIFSFLFFTYVIRRDRRIFFVLFTVLIAAATVSVMKFVIARPRPLLNQPYMPLLDAYGYSFPSGHSALSFTVVVMFYYLNRKYALASLLIAILAAFSRIYVAAHYVSDVIAGGLLGVIVAVLCIRFSPRIYRLESRMPAISGQSI